MEAILRYILYILFSISMLIIQSCDSDKLVTISPDNIIFGPNNGLTYDDIYFEYTKNIDPNNIVGSCEMLREDYDNLTPFSFSSNQMVIDRANVYLYHVIGETYLKIGAVEINNYALEISGHNPNVYIARGHQGDPSSFNISFGSSNSIKINGNNNFDGVDTTISIISPFAFTNISNGARISKSSGLNLSWNTTGSDYVGITIMEVRADTTDNSISAGSCFVENVGGYYFVPNQMQQFENGFYDIIITDFMPYFLYDRFGKIIVATVEYRKTMTIELVD